MNIVLAGATGFLGRALVRRLAGDGHALTVLTRRPRQPREVQWDPAGSPAALTPLVQHADAVINLAGAPISKRWTAAHKREMWDSRIQATRTLVQAIRSLPKAPALLNASAVGIYGARGDEPITEDSAAGSTFLAALGREWEKEALAAAAVTRVVLLRTGIALERDGGALPLMALPFRLFVGGPLGSGRQYLSWIHRDDWVAMVRWALTTTSVSGPLNVTAPNPVTNAEFSRTIARVLGRPSLLPVPALALRVAVGEMASELVTGQRVLPEKARAGGFVFAYPELEGALRGIYGR
jgi:uncharacterized protein (TIGR01777 family)